MTHIRKFLFCAVSVFVFSGNSIHHRGPNPATWSIPGITDDLISYWDMDEGSGVRYDSTDTNNDWTDNNTVTSAAGKVGNAAVYVRGNSEYLSIASNASLQTGNIDWTVVGWFYIDSNNSGRSTGVMRKGTDYQLSWIFTTYYQLMVDGISTILSVNSCPLDEWHFVVFGYDSSQGKGFIQIDGNAMEYGNAGGTPSADADAVTIGYPTTSGTNYMSGMSDEVVFYKRLLSAEEIAFFRNGGSGRTWPLE